MTDVSRLSYHMSTMDFPDTPTKRWFNALVPQATAAERSDFDRITVMDHFFAIPALGKQDDPLLESYTLLPALAQHTDRVRVATLVTG